MSDCVTCSCHGGSPRSILHVAQKHMHVQRPDDVIIWRATKHWIVNFETSASVPEIAAGKFAHCELLRCDASGGALHCGLTGSDQVGRSP